MEGVSWPVGGWSMMVAVCHTHSGCTHRGEKKILDILVELYVPNQQVVV